MKGKGPGPNRELGEGYRLVSLGMTFAAGVIVFALGGFLLDRWLGLTPLFTVLGTLVGATLSFISVYFKLIAPDGKRDEQGRDRE